MKYHNYEYTIVTEPPLGYEIWNIKDAPNGCLPFCRLKMMQPFDDAVGNFISDETGFFHKGYHLSTDPE